jgi:hypothetical protein
MLGKVVVDDEGILAAVAEILAHGAARVGRDVLEGRGILGRGGHHDRVLHGSIAPKGVHNFCNGGGFLADGDVDAVDALVFLVDDGVDGDRGFSGAAVANDELALAAADGGEGVDALDPCLERGIHRLAHDHAGRFGVGFAESFGFDGRPAV